MTVIPFDRRATYRAVNEPELIGFTMDIDAEAAATYGLLEAAHQAYWTEDAPRFLRAITRAGEKVVRIGKIAREASGAIEASPVVPVDQLAIWTRPDGAVVSDSGTAA